MTIDDKVRDEKLQYDVNRKTAQISALSSRKSGETLTPDQRRVIEQGKFAYSPLGKAFEKQTKTMEEQGRKQVDALEVLDPEKKSKTKISWRAFSKRN